VGLAAGGGEGDGEGDRPGTASSTFSNPASRHNHLDGGGGTGFGEDGTAMRASAVVEADASCVTGREQQQHRPCARCEREGRTYLVELTNYPDLQYSRERAAVLARGEYDAVLLVYDVGSRASYDVLPGLAREISLYGRGGRRMKRASVEGLEVAVGGKVGRMKLRRRRSSAVVGDIPAVGRVSSSMSFRNSYRQYHGTTAPVLAMVGNKADLDAEFATIDLGLEAKRAALEEVDVEERGLVHPLYRDSQIYRDGLDAGGDIGVAIGGIPELLPRPKTVKRDTAASSTRPLLSPYSGRSFVSDGQDQEMLPRERGHPEAEEEWPLTGRMAGTGKVNDDAMSRFKPTALPTRTYASHPNLDSVIRRSAVSADYHLLATNRTSILSKRSVRTMQEGSKPLVLTKLPKSEAVENWIRTGSPTTAEHPGVEEDEEQEENVDDAVSDAGGRSGDRQGLAEGRGRSYSTTTTTAAPSRRQVSRVEGEMLARTLVADVPFYETSAKTGENVEEMFGAVVREVLRRRGVEAAPDAVVLAGCRRKHGQKKGRRKAKPKMAGGTKDQAELAPGLPDETGEERETPVIVDELPEADGSYTEFHEAQGTEHRRRRQSMLDRFRRVFIRKAPVMVDEVVG